MKFYKLLLKYRLHIGLALLILTIVMGVSGERDWFWLVLILTFVALASHVLFGPLRLIQDAMQEGDMERADKIIKTVYFPRLLIKPVRQGYYMLKSNMAMANKDFASAEDFTMKGMKSKSKYMGGDNGGSAYLQLGMIALQKGKSTEARKHLKAALAKGLPDKESQAAAYLQLCSIEVQIRQVKSARIYFKKAKDLKPKSPEIKAQIAQIEKYIHRVR